MDEADQKTPATPVPPPSPEARRETPAGGSGRDVVDDLRADAEKTLQQIKGHGFRDFFNFNKLIFPDLARIIFVAFTIAMIFMGVLGVVAGFASMSELGFFAGLAGVAGAVVTSVFMIVLARIWIEIVLVAFKIHDGIQDIRKTLSETH